MRPDFSLIWGADNAPFTAIEASDYAAGWVFRTGAPPRRVNFDYFQNLSDQRTAWLGEQMLLAVGHEWQDDVTYDAYAITRSPADGQLYRSLVGGNLGNEPSVSGYDWALGVAPSAPATLLTSGISGSASNLKMSATGLSAAVTVTADSVCLKNSSNEQVVLNAVSLAPSLAASGVNGLDSGTSSASTWYSVWVIWNGTTTAGLLSLSATAPTMPGGYTHKARVGWIRTDATVDKRPLSFVQNGLSWRYKIATGSNVLSTPVLATGIAGDVTTPTYAAVSLVNFIPPTASKVSVAANTYVSSSSLMVHPNPNGGTVASGANMPVISQSVGPGGGASSFAGDIVLESNSIYWANNSSIGYLACFGFEDNL